MVMLVGNLMYDIVCISENLVLLNVTAGHESYYPSASLLLKVIYLQQLISIQIFRYVHNSMECIDNLYIVQSMDCAVQATFMDLCSVVHRLCSSMCIYISF